VVAVLKLTLVFAGVVLLLGREWNLGLVLLLGSAAVGLLFGYPLPEVGRDVLLTTVDLLTLRLALAVVLIMTLGELLRQTASMKGMVEALQALIPNGRIVIAALPALIGLLPMVGGAMFSAPMVDEVGDWLGVDRERKTFVNYWFRHIWEPIFPLYPSMMLGAALLGLTTMRLARATWPLTAAAVAAGVVFGLLGVSSQGAGAGRRALQEARSREARLQLSPSSRGGGAPMLALLAKSVWPIALVIFLSLTLPVDERLTLILSLVATITLMMAVRRIPLRELGVILRERIPWKSVVVIFGALIFRRVLENSSAVVAVSDGLTELRIPLPVVAFGAPLIAGLLTGLMAAAYSIGFPVVLPLVVAEGGGIAPEWAVWLMAGGIVGTMLSPVHLCLGLTRVYFKAEWGPVYRLLAPSALLVTATAVGVLLFSSV